MFTEEVKEKPKGRPKGSVKVVKNERDKITRQKAIRLFCLECMGYQTSVIKDCPDVPCPLWCYRAGRGFEHTDIQIRKK